MDLCDRIRGDCTQKLPTVINTDLLACSQTSLQSVNACVVIVKALDIPLF